jgi:DNA-binding NarL/FixJ family response regulator
MPGADRLRVLIIGRDRGVRRALRDLLTAEPGLDVSGTASDPGSALARAAAQRPDAVLLDLPQPDPAEGLGLVLALHRLGIPVVVLSNTASLRQQAQTSGAAAFLEKDGNLHRIAQALRATGAGPR